MDAQISHERKNLGKRMADIEVKSALYGRQEVLSDRFHYTFQFKVSKCDGR